MKGYSAFLFNNNVAIFNNERMKKSKWYYHSERKNLRGVLIKDPASKNKEKEKRKGAQKGAQGESIKSEVVLREKERGKR